MYNYVNWQTMTLRSLTVIWSIKAVQNAEFDRLWEIWYVQKCEYVLFAKCHNMSTNIMKHNNRVAKYIT